MSKIFQKVLGKRPEPKIKHENSASRDFGFSEDAMKGLEELEVRLPPADAASAPAFQPGFSVTDRLKSDVTAGGGMLKGDDGVNRPHYWGHRARLRARFLEGGHAPMPDYEVLELLLFNAIERIDVKPLAKRLLAEFGDLNGVVAASKPRVLKVEGATDKVFLQLRIVEAFTHRLARAKVLDRPVLASWEALIDYLSTVMAHRETEQLRTLFLDRKNVLVADEGMSEGTVDHVPVYPREVIKRALELNATALILVHNHPSGDPTPSENDIAMTARTNEAAEALGITLHDHIIIGKSAELSFRAEGLL